MTPILAAMMEATGGDQGGHVVIDPPMFAGALIIFLLLLPLLMAIGVVYYKKKWQHQQILAAIEKGIPVSELMARPANGINWIRNLSAGIGLLVIAVILFFVVKEATDGMNPDAIAWLVIPAVIFGLGLMFLLRGVLQRKAEQGQTKK